MKLDPANPLTETEVLMIRLREEMKLTLRDIAGQLDVSVARAGQIYRAACNKRSDVAEHGEDATSLLPKRARQLVVAHGISSRALVRSAIKNGRLTWNETIGGIFWDGAMVRNASRKTWTVLYNWGGQPARPYLALNQTKLQPITKHDAVELSRLPARVRQLVVAHEIPKRILARSAIETGLLTWTDEIGSLSWNGRMITQAGRKTWAVLYEWAGRPAIPKWVTA